MGFMYLTESSTLRLSEEIHPADSSVEVQPVNYNDAVLINILDNFKGPAKFHIGMLSISLIAGLAYGGYVTYNCWREKNVFLSHIRNLVIALTCRTFYTILFEGVIILESPLNVNGGNTLLSFECICLNLVLAFWLTFTIYIHIRVQSNFNSEPTLKLYMYGVPGIAVYFALVWIFAMEGTHSSEVWWLYYHFQYFYQWVVNSLRLLYLLIQLALLIDIGRMMMVKSNDNDTISLMRKVAVLMVILVLLFWLQFGLSVGRPSITNPKPYLYFFYFIDGTQCLLVCLVLFFFNKWVPMILDKLQNIVMENGQRRTSRSNDEVLITDVFDRGIVTIDSLFMTQESGRWKNTNYDGCKDVVYSSIVQPQNLQKTIDLYKRLNVIPTDKVTIVEGEEFYDCDLRSGSKRSDSFLLKRAQNLGSENGPNVENKVSEKVVKKNAFYSSKYLIVDSKEKDIPKYLETRPGTYSTGSETKKNLRRDLSTSLETLGADELVEKWLRDNSEDMEDARRTQSRLQKVSTEKNKEKKKKVPQNTTNRLEEHRPNGSETIVSTVNSVLLGGLFPNRKEKSLSLEGNPEALDTKNDSNRISKNSDIFEVENGMNNLKGQIQNGKNYKEVLDLRPTEELSSERENVKTIEKDKRAFEKKSQNNLKQTENIQDNDSEQNKTAKHNAGNAIPEYFADEKALHIDTIPDAREKPQVPSTDAICNDSSTGACDTNPLQSAPAEVTQSQMEENTLTPTKDMEEGAALQDETKTPEKLEAMNDTEKNSERDLESNLSDTIKGSDFKKHQDLPSSTVANLENKCFEDSEANGQYLTYSELLAFRSQRDKLEKENLNEKDQKLKTPGLNEIKLLTGNPHKFSHPTVPEAEGGSESSI